MARTANIFTRVDPQIKEQAENVFNQLGISMATAMVIIFYWTNEKTGGEIVVFHIFYGGRNIAEILSNEAMLKDI